MHRLLKMSAITWLAALGVPKPFSRVQVAFVAGYSPRSSSFSNPLSALRTRELIQYPAGRMVDATQQGYELAFTPEAPGTVEDLHRRVFERLSGPQARILRPLIDAHPDPVDRAALADAAGYSATSSSFSNPLSSLRTLGLIEPPVNRQERAADLLFL